MRYDTFNDTRGQTECILWLNDSYWINMDTEFTLMLSGKAFLNYHLERALNWGLRQGKDLSNFSLATSNNFPTERVKFSCQDVPREWTCRDQVERCQKILRSLVKQVIITEYKRERTYDRSLIKKVEYLKRICSSARVFWIYFEGFKSSNLRSLCIGDDRLYSTGVVFCRAFFKCLDTTLDAITDYAMQAESCRFKFSQTNHSGISQYGFQNYLRERYEYVETTLANPKLGIAYHFHLQCAWKLPIIKLYLREDRIQCRRRVSKIVRSLAIIPTCNHFVSECEKVLQCLNRQTFCPSIRFGLETAAGFVIDDHVSKEEIIKNRLCNHWAVEVTKRNVKHRHCYAKRIFTLKGLTFCQSYEWACWEVIHCIQRRRKCTYSVPDHPKKFSVLELGDQGIVNYEMLGFSPHENPRKHVPALYKCNKRYGYQHRVFLYFITTVCDPSYHDCNLNMSIYTDPETFELRWFAILGLLAFTNPRHITPTYNRNPEKLFYIWACKRDVLSSISCPDFLKICSEIRRCLIEKELNEETTELPRDDTCYSPMPLSTINPFPENDLGGRGHAPGILGPSLNHIMVLKKSYPRIFKRSFFTGFEGETNDHLKNRRAHLFHNLFLEDCRHYNEFEGFLIEPYLTERVDYLICSIPFGIKNYRENQLVVKGCSHMQKVCENMMKCYERHAEYFGFHSFLNDNVFTLAVLMMVIFALSMIATIATHQLFSMRVPLMERVNEYFVHVALGFTGISLLVFSLQVTQLGIQTGFVSSNIVLVLKVFWHVGTFFLTVAFHIFIVLFTFRLRR